MGVDDLYREMVEKSSKLSEIFFEYRTGHLFDSPEMSELSNSLNELHLEFLNSYAKPKSLRLACLSGISRQASSSLIDKIEHEQGHRISSREHGIPFGSWKNLGRYKTGAIRKEIFDQFIEQAPSLSNLVHERFQSSKTALEQYGYNPLKLYEEGEGMSYNESMKLLQKIGKIAIGYTKQERNAVVSGIWGDVDVDYSYDYMAISERIYESMGKHLKRIDPISKFKEILETLDIRCSAEIRKEPGFFRTYDAFVTPIYNKKKSLVFIPQTGNKFRIMSTTFHELGHAVEHTYQKTKEKPSEMVDDNTSFSSNREFFSLFFESLLRDERYLVDSLKLHPDVVSEIRKRQKFMLAFYLSFFSTRGMLKLEFWKKSMTIDESIIRFGQLANKFYIPHFPGAYWLLDLHMVTDDLIMPTYVIGAIHAANLRKYLENEFQRDWWKSKDAGSFIKELANSPSSFIRKSNLNPQILFELKV